MIDLIELRASITANTKQFEADTARAARNVKAIDDALNSLNKKKVNVDSGSFLKTASEIGNVVSGIKNGISIVESFASSLVTTTESFVGLIKSASDYGREISQAETKTGLSAATISALKLAAQESGKEFTNLQQPLTMFGSLLGAAARGSETAQIKLKALGVTNFRDLDGSLSQVFKRIESLPAGLERMNATADAFGARSKGEMIPIIDKIGGNLAEAAKQAENFGLVLSDTDLQAARDFNAYYTTVSAQLEALGAKFLLELAPDVSNSMADVETSLSKNQNAVQIYGETFAAVFRGIKTDVVDTVDFLGSHINTIDAVMKTVVPSYRTFSDTADAITSHLESQGGGVKSGSNFTELSNAEKQKKFAAENADTGSKVGVDASSYLDETEQTSAEKLSILKKNNETALAFNQEAYQLSEARLKSHLTFTIAEQIQAAKQEGDLQRNSLLAQISVQTNFFKDELSAVSKGSIEYQEITANKVKVLSKLNNDLELNEVKTQTEVQKYENQSYEARRKAAIDFKQIQIRESQFKIDVKTFDIDRVKGDYDALTNLTRQSFTEILAFTRQSYAEQLKDKSLTDEQYFNLARQGYLDEQKLAEDNRRVIIGIEEKQYQNSLEKIETAFNRRKTLLESYAQDTQFGIGLLTPEAFSANTSSLIQRSLTGADYSSLEKDTFEPLKDKQWSMKGLRASAEFGLDRARTNGDKEAVIKLSAELEMWTAKLEANQKQLDNWKDLVDENALSVDSLVEKIKSGNGAIGDFDKLGLESLKLRQKTEIAGIDEEIASYNKRIKTATDSGRSLDAETLTYERAAAERKKNTIVMQSEAEIAAYLAHTYDGLNDSLKKLHSGDKVSVGLVKSAADTQIKAEQNREAEDVIVWQEKLAHAGEDAADRYKTAWLKALYEIKDADTQAVESEIASRARLADMLTVHSEQIKAKTLEVLASQKSITDILGDAQAGAVTDAFAAIDSSVHSLAQSLGIADTAAGHFFETMLAGLAKLALNDFFKKLFGSSDGSDDGSDGQKSGGGWLSKLLNMAFSAIGAAFGGGGGGGGGGLSSASFWAGEGDAGIGAYAGGGDVTGDAPILVGEKEPEIFFPRTSGTVLNQNQLAQVGKGQNNVTINYAPVFYANKQSGAFSKPSAHQTAKDLLSIIENAGRRG